MPATPKNRRLPQPSVLHFLLLTSTIPSDAGVDDDDDDKSFGVDDDDKSFGLVSVFDKLG